MTPQQKQYLNDLTRMTSHPVEVLGNPSEIEGRSVTVHVTWPNLYLTISPDGKLVETLNETQYRKANQT